MNYSEETSAAMSGVPRILFFDNGFFRALLKGDFQHHLANQASDLSVAIKLPFRPWRTPFSFMEWIGLNSQSLPKPEPFNPATVLGKDFIAPSYRHYEKHYATVSELDRENLEKLAAKQRDYVCPKMVDIWDSAMSGIFDERDVSGWLRFAMSFDAVLKLKVSRDYNREYWSDLISGFFFEADPRVQNISKFRLAYRMWIQTMEKLNYPGASDNMLRCIKEAHGLLTLGNWKDYLDSDLVHVAAYGIVDSVGTRHRTVCITCDPPEVVNMRIRLYKGLLSYVRKLYGKEADDFPPDFDSSHNGKVFCFDLQGNLVRKIDVVSETPALAFLGEPA